MGKNLGLWRGLILAPARADKSAFTAAMRGANILPSGNADSRLPKTATSKLCPVLVLEEGLVMDTPTVISTKLKSLFPKGGASRWVTRERPKIDRIACPWLVLRFVDPKAEFLYVPPERVIAEGREQGAEPYDIPGVRFSHRGERCSFDAFIEEFELQGDEALERVALIVRGADTGTPALAPEAP